MTVVPRPFVIALLLCAACRSESEGAGVASVGDDHARRLAAREAPAEPLVDPEAPLDVRLVRIEPERHTGQERVCDVVHAGLVQELGARTSTDYPIRAAARRLVRCRGALSEGWADLLFSQASASLAASATAGTRTRVKVLAPRGGFEDAPVLEFVAVIGPRAVPPPSADEFRGVPAAFDFRIPAERSSLVGTEQPCAVLFVGWPEPIPETAARRYPRGATHHMPVVCAHAEGDAWVDFVFAEPRAHVALSLRRGDRVPVRILSADGGTADLPIVSFAAAPATPQPAS